MRNRIIKAKRPVQVTAAILTDNGKVFIAKRPIGDKLAKKWEFPGGKIRGKESPEACLAREMKEEFNIEVSVGEFLGSSVYHYPHISIKLLAYRTVWVSGDMDSKAHDASQGVLPCDLDQYDFAPADLPFVQRIRRGDIEI